MTNHPKPLDDTDDFVNIQRIKSINTLWNRIDYLEKQLLVKDRTIYKHLSTIMEQEEKYQAAVKRADKLQLELNRLERKLARYE